MEAKHQEVSGLSIKAFYNVYNMLGVGFSEKVYHNSMMVELRRMGLSVVKEQEIRVHFRGQVVGEYYADIVVNDVLILELKAVKELISQHEAQVLNYLRATKYEVALLLNFGPEPQIQRKSYNNNAKGNMSWLQE